MKRIIAGGLLFSTLAAVGACSRFESSSRPSESKTSTASGGARSGAAADTSETVTATGYGPLRIGMTVVDAAAALGSPAPPMAGADTACSYVHIRNEPAGMRLMVVGGKIARIEIDSSSIATGLGARVGDTEARVHELYGSRLTVQPHKYLPNGHYLIANPIPASDTGFKLVFETDGNRVTKYRAGRMPEVQWVEGCA